MHKGANFTAVSTKFLIGLNIKFYQIFAKPHVYCISRLSLTNTEILCEEHVNCKLFLAIVCNSHNLSKSFNTKKRPLKIVFKYILFRKLHFCRFMHSLGENEKYSYVRNAYCAITKEIAFRVTRIVTLKNYCRAMLRSLP